MDARELAELLAAPFGLGAGAVVAVYVAQWVLNRLAAGGDGYARKKGENLATKEDLADAIKQLNALETARAGVAHEDWSAREWKAARARKLEELILAMHAYHLWVHAMRERATRSLAIDAWEGSHEPKIWAIQQVYFPELRELVSTFVARTNDFFLGVLDLSNAMASAAGDEAPQVDETHHPVLLKLASKSQRAMLACESTVGVVLERIYGRLPEQPMITEENAPWLRLYADTKNGPDDDTQTD